MDYLRLLKINQDYFQFYSKTGLNESLIYKQEEKIVISFLKSVEDGFLIEFKNVIKNSYKNLKKEELPKEFQELIQSRINEESNNNVNLLLEINQRLKEIKGDLSVPLLSENQIIQNLNPHGNFLFQLMNK